MKLNFRPFYNADTAVASPPAPAAPAPSLADSVMAAISNKAAAAFPTNPFQAGTQVVYSSTNGQTTASPVAPAPVVAAPALETPPAATEQPAAPVHEPPATPPPNNDYLIIRHPDTGQILTRVKNDPDSVSNYIQNQQLFIRELRNGAPAQPQAPAAPQGPTPEQIRAADIQRAKAAAQHFLKADPTANIDPLAETLADAFAAMRGELRSEFETREQAAQRAHTVAQQDAELAQIQTEDPTFTLDAPDVVRLRQQYPDAGPTQIQAMRIYHQFKQFRANPPANPAATTTAAPAAPAQPKVPDTTWMQPTGTSVVAAQTGYDTHPYVIAAIDSFKRMAPSLGKQITPESIERIKQTAINTIKNTDAAKGGFR